MRTKLENRLDSWIKAGRVFFSVADSCGKFGKVLATGGAALIAVGYLASLATDLSNNRVNHIKQKLNKLKTNSAK
jgi:hypothetical protein